MSIALNEATGLYDNALRSFALWLMQCVATFIQCLKHLRAFLVQMIRWRSVDDLPFRSYLEALTRNVFIEECLKGIYHWLHRGQEALGFQGVVEGTGGNTGSYDVGTDSIECYAFLWEVLPE